MPASTRHSSRGRDTSSTSSSSSSSSRRSCRTSQNNNRPCRLCYCSSCSSNSSSSAGSRDGLSPPCSLSGSSALQQLGRGLGRKVPTTTRDYRC